MTNDDKEFLLNLLDDLDVFLLESINEKTILSNDLFQRIARARMVLERNYFKLDNEVRQELNFNDWHAEQDFMEGSDD